MRKNLTLIISFLFLGNMVAKSAVFVQTVIVCSSGEHNLLMYIPDDYNASSKYALVIALQPCDGGVAKYYLNALKPITDSLKMIVVAPDNSAQAISNANLDIITASIDSAMAMYNIDEKLVYLTGFSCNGEVALRQGLKKIFPFKGIFPYAPYIPGVNPNVFDLNSDMPITIAVGTKEEYSFVPILNLYDSLKNHGATVNLILIPGITHTYNFPEFGNKMISCLHYLNDTNLISIKYSDTQLPNFEMLDTDPEKELVFKVANEEDKELTINSLSSNVSIVADPEITYTPSDSTVKIKFKPIVGKKGKVVIVLEAQEKNGMAIEQVTFKVTVALATNIAATFDLNSKLEAYPNPASEKIYLKCNEDILYVQIVDICGRVVLKTMTNKDSSIDISALKGGVYFLDAKGKSNYDIVKFLIK